VATPAHQVEQVDGQVSGPRFASVAMPVPARRPREVIIEIEQNGQLTPVAVVTLKMAVVVQRDLLADIITGNQRRAAPTRGVATLPACC
jgi:hypothetical protein